MAKARDHACHRVWLITSNDNIRAIRYYKKEASTSRPSTGTPFRKQERLNHRSLIGLEGIPVQHEIGFEYLLVNNGSCE
ncbi:hypothetical protein [Paenibacillus spongiae]|uniref:hypothetical protein n=1 Tax=Paenibacillus spongiae TaxID=2909671 RepID=UPI0035A25E63